jgi:hypothetical protein
MKRESVIVSSFLIERQKQIKLFQVKIPREAKNIIGVEMGMLWLSGIPPVEPAAPIWSLPMNLKRNLILGEVKLQSYEKANIFFTSELALDKNISFADFTSQSFVPSVFSHGQSRHEDPVRVNGDTTILQGVYRDKLSEQQAGNYSYIVKIYIWTEAKVDQSHL